MIAALAELAPEGFEQVDGGHFVEFAVYGAPGELPELSPGRAELGGVTVEVSGTEIGDDWAERWRQFHNPVQVGRIHVRAPWHDPHPEGIDIVIDPGQAFGTGAHPTTQMCLELLQDLPGRGPLSDLGCGSGVLAIAAAKLGFSPVGAFDNERAAIEATLGNASANDVALDRVERHDLRAKPAPVADVTVANLVRPLLLEVAALLAEQPETLMVSGLLEGEEDEVAAAFAHLRERRRLRLQGWSALLLTRP
ncbi:MAG TPA: 50S ribosomal protein L11 methyltransferase [Thermoleophilaceae bacterium]